MSRHPAFSAAAAHMQSTFAYAERCILNAQQHQEHYALALLY